MHHIPLAKVVGCHYSGSVVGVLPSEHTLASELAVLKEDIELRGNVLCRAYPDAGLFLVLVGEQGAPIAELRVRSLGVELREGLRSVGVQVVRSVEDGVVYLLSLEIVVELGRRADHSKVRCIYVLLIEWVFREVVVERCVLLLKGYVVEIAVVLPHNEPLVMHRVRDGECLKNTWSRLPDTVLACLDAVLYLRLTVCCCNQGREPLLIVVFLALHS